MSAILLPTHTPALFLIAVREAVRRLRAGEVVGMPTETVYGLAANALDADAVRRIFAIKGRPAHNPVIVHVASMTQARECAGRWPPLASVLASVFWPGPLTVIVPRSLRIPDVVTAGGDTVAIRWPQHPFMQAVIRECGFPLAAPSANLSNQLSPTTARHVQAQLEDRLDCIVDGGQCQVGIESTVVDVTGERPHVLRPGMISEMAIHAVAKSDLESARQEPIGTSQGPLRSPGMLPRHYSPKATLLVLRWKDEADLVQQLSAREVTADCFMDATFSDLQILAHCHIPLGGRFPNVSVIPHDAEAFARALYGELHRCDEAGARWIIVEAPPATPEWAGVADRLRRAAA